MRRILINAGLVILLSGWIFVNLSDQQTVADDCDTALDALATCQQTSIPSNCPADCQGGNQNNGVEYSGSTVYTTTEGSSVADGTEQVNCSRPLTCTATPHEDEDCFEGDPSWYCDEWLLEDCTTYQSSEGNWVKSPSAKIKACPT
jgi:hypothetical protein